MGRSLPLQAWSCVVHISPYVHLPRGGAGFMYLITVPNFPWLHRADPLAMLVYSMILSSLNIHTAILPVWKLRLFYSLWPKPGLLMP